MPAIPLPENASLEHLRNQAKLVRRLVLAGDEGTLDLIREFHPRFAELISSSPPVRFKLADAQMTIARLYGQPSWNRLRDQLGLLDAHTRPDPADVDETDNRPNRFVALACVSYNGDPDSGERIDQARALHRQDPDLAGASIAALAVTGDHPQMTERIAHDPSIVNAPCGPNGWPPLLYCCFSRLDLGGAAHSTVRTARLLLEAGADPNDGQALYNNGLAGTAVDDPAHLALLVEFGLGTTTNGPWYERFGTRLTPPEELLYDELEVAAHRGLPNRMRFLVDLGLDLERPVGRSRRTPWQLANDAGHNDVLAVLAAAGATGPDTPR